MESRLLILRLSPCLALLVCSHIAKGPSLMALPGSGIPFDRLRYDDEKYRRKAARQ